MYVRKSLRLRSTPRELRGYSGIRVHLYLFTGPFQMVVLNDINSVTEALVKRKADFANRPFIKSGMHKLFALL